MMFEDDKDYNLFFKGWRNSMSESNIQSRNGKIELNDYAQNCQNKTLHTLRSQRKSLFCSWLWSKFGQDVQRREEGGLVGNRSLFA